MARSGVEVMESPKGSVSSAVIPPTSVKGMTSLDRTAFTSTFVVAAIRVPERSISVVRPIVKNQMLPFRRLHIAEASDSEKLLLLDPKLIHKWEDLTNIQVANLQKHGLMKSHFTHHELTITYDDWTKEDIFSAVLPDEQNTLSCFSMIGHIIHLNVKPLLMEYRHLIAHVLVDKVRQARTIVNKTNVIDTTYRNFEMELLAGDDDMVTQVLENGCKFALDFSCVYWNPRLSTEHERVIKLLNETTVVYDVFAGIGPFVIPALKQRRCLRVLANDLNPESYKWLVYNGNLNKLDVERFLTYNLDGRKFIQDVLRKDIIKSQQAMENCSNHVIMNLPAMAVEFLDAFRGLFSGGDSDLSEDYLPVIHCYTFTKDIDTEEHAKEDVVSRVGKVLDYDISGKCSVHYVRGVAPNKDMYRITFTMPLAVLQPDAEEPQPKRQKYVAANSV